LSYGHLCKDNAKTTIYKQRDSTSLSNGGLGYIFSHVSISLYTECVMTDMESKAETSRTARDNDRLRVQVNGRITFQHSQPPTEQRNMSGV